MGVFDGFSCIHIVSISIIIIVINLLELFMDMNLIPYFVVWPGIPSLLINPPETRH